jgi:uncharacterized protein YukE
MSDGYQVSLPALVRLAGSFAGQQQSFRQLGDPVQQRAAAVDTGDAALDAEVRTVIDTVHTLFGQFGDVLEQTGTVLAEITADYEERDQRVVDDMDRIAAEDLGGRTNVPQV